MSGKYWPIDYGFQMAKDKLTIYFTADAYVKASLLVDAHPMEVGWDMVIKPHKDGYIVEDVLVYPQEVSPAYIHVDPSTYGMWKAGLSENEDKYLCGQAHSHVNMSVTPSTTDMANQKDGICSKKGGYFLYQIWNKRNDITSLFYDIDHKIFYPSCNIQIEVELKDKTVSEFIMNSYQMAEINNNDDIPAEFMEDFDEFK